VRIRRHDALETAIIDHLDVLPRQSFEQDFFADPA
jgi:hypothetical protein